MDDLKTFNILEIASFKNTNYKHCVSMEFITYF